MASPKLKLCLVLTLVVMALHRVESQCGGFVTQPVDTIAVRNSYTCLTCDYPDSSMEDWYRDRSIIESSTTLCDCNVTHTHQARLCFGSVTEADVDTYSCEVLLDFGEVVTCPANLVLAEPPVIDKSSTAPLNVIEGNTATIPVSVTGLPSPTVQFTKDDAVLSSSSPRFTISNTSDDWELTITDVDRADRGDYSIVANNIAGDDTFSRRLLVQFTPVLTVEQSARVNSMITLTCTAIAYPRPIAVQWQRISDEMILDVTEIFTETDIDFTVTTTTTVDVSVCESEGYRCVVQNSRGTARQSVTLCSDPPNPPAITVTAGGSTSILVTWVRVANPLATNYTIEYRPVGENGPYMSRTVQEDSSASYSETIGDLTRGTEYELRAVSANSAGRGDFGALMTVKLPSGDPVTGVSVYSTVENDQRAIGITWDEYPEPVSEYLIHYTKSGMVETPERVGPDENSFLLTLAQCSSMITFTFQIQAVTLLGEGPTSHRVQLEVDCTIQAELPPPAVTIQNVVLSGTAVTVTWQVNANTSVEGLVIVLSEFDSNGVRKVTKYYTVPQDEFEQLSKCVGELTPNTAYEICIAANVSVRISEELDCYESTMRTLEDDTEDVSNCAMPTAVELGDPGPSAEPSNGGIADWVIAVIVVGVLAIVALVFCLMGVFFACHTSRNKGGAEFGSQSSIHTESLSSNVHIHDHRSMSSTNSCFAHQLKGHSTNWGDHADTLKALESGAPTAV